jgi:hypothetical protein
MSLADNLRDLERHAQDFTARRGFTCTVLSTAAGEVIGCVHIYPPREQGPDHLEAGGRPVKPWPPILIQTPSICCLSGSGL